MSEGPDRINLREFRREFMSHTREEIADIAKRAQGIADQITIQLDQARRAFMDSREQRMPASKYGSLSMARDLHQDIRTQCESFLSFGETAPVRADDYGLACEMIEGYRYWAWTFQRPGPHAPSVELRYFPQLDQTTLYEGLGPERCTPKRTANGCCYMLLLDALDRAKNNRAWEAKP